ncbi:DUF1273 domain-containing protein [Bacillus solimangrovi]|uniref:UPF0398 protein BFG57_14070 n=1 Tax=Bacillus solimangrovi TaxID=1305675 RepID=A0A1E5LG07_9BACI|nr:DUF1273 domain-containing protein [Bacillus solimangrovi]OEH92986.1 hypothetical protein BFG57_14070 [Bacillus solimangrovi]
MKVVTVTGYKPYELGIFQDSHPAVHFIKKALKKQIVQLVEGGLEWILISGQPGVELWCAEVVFELQEQYPVLQLGVITAILNHHERWKDEQKESYEMILAQADYVDTLSKRPYEGPWQFRNLNEWLIDKSDALLVIYDEEKQGTPQYLLNVARRAQEHEQYEIIMITPFDIQMIAEDEQMSNPDYWTQ